MLELLLGFTLLTVAIFALFALFPTGDKAVMRSVKMTQAQEIARGLMERELLRNYSDLTDGVASGETSASGINRNGVEISTRYLYQVEITQPDPTLRFKDIEVTVSWEEGSEGDTRKVVLNSSKGELI